MRDTGAKPHAGDEGQASFVPAGRESIGAVHTQAGFLSASPLVAAVLEAGINCMLILNQGRQIVATSSNLGQFARGKQLDELVGVRLGEGLSCVHAFEGPEGCGNAEACHECGALRAILSGLGGVKAREECRISRVVNGEFEALDLDVLSTPLEVRGERFAVVAISDLSQEKRRRALERIFYHDVINLAGGVEGLLDNLRVSVASDLLDDTQLAYSMTRGLIEEIVAQRDLAAAERSELKVQPSMVNSMAFLRKIAAAYRSHPVCERRNIVVDEHSDLIEFVTDATLLTRVLGNLVKNAAEASQVGETITLGCELGGLKLKFWVHNMGVIPREIQHQMFQRSFSTKGMGRGLGTYSVKFLVERCLEGSVDFESKPEMGTRFRVVLPLVLQ